MRDFDWNSIRRGKELHRAHLAALPSEAKLRVVERLRDEGLTMKGAVAVRTRDPAGTLNVVGHSMLSNAAAAICLNAVGANATFVSAMTGSVNSAVAGNDLPDRTR